MKKLTLVISLAAFAMVSQLCFAVELPPPVPEDSSAVQKSTHGAQPAEND